MPTKTTTAVCTACGDTSTKSTAAVAISVLKNGSYVCGPCLRARPEAKARHLASLDSIRQPKTIVCRCRGCGVEREIPKSTARYHGRNADGGYDWRCVACGAKAGAPLRASCKPKTDVP